MTMTNTRSVLISLCTALACFSFSSHADVQEIPVNELTDSFIENTTVIISKEEATTEDAHEVDVTIKPNQGHSESQLLGDKYDPNNEQYRRPDLKPLSDENLAHLQIDSITDQKVYILPFTQSTKNNDENLRKILKEKNIPFESVGIPNEGPIDYSQLKFPTGLTPSGPSSGAAGIEFNNSNPDQFIISIPNKGFNSISNNQDLNSDIQVKINNDVIQLILNNPNRP